MQAPEALTGMSDDQSSQIRSMVEGLATRLKDNPGDVEGWFRYKGLKEDNHAVQAIKTARKSLSADEVSRINLVATELDLFQ
jgi:cytochrome c-type biogenesis protein CcmH